jgi:hypothetical protein
MNDQQDRSADADGGRTSFEAGIDILHDPRNCGGIGAACTFDHATAYCDDGKCRLAACDSGYGNADRLENNGCECQVHPEVCDGEDNDCDGLIDFVAGATGSPTSLCKCEPKEVAIVLDGNGREPDGRNPQCTVDACSDDGAASMTFCCDSNGAYGQCKFRGAALNAFDADHGNLGVLEIAFQLRDRVTGLGLNLWYGNYPRRKQLHLLSSEETKGGIGPGIIVKYFRPEDVSCPTYVRSDKVVNPNAFGDYPDECFVDEVDGGRAWRCPKGRWGALNAKCGRFTYDDVFVYVTAEQCEARVSSAVSILSIRHVDPIEACLCRDDASCHPGEHCHPEASLPAPWCDGGRCAGVCSTAAACPHFGSPCSVTVGGRTCMSRVICGANDELCPVPSSCH